MFLLKRPSRPTDGAARYARSRYQQRVASPALEYFEPDPTVENNGSPLLFSIRDSLFGTGRVIDEIVRDFVIAVFAYRQ